MLIDPKDVREHSYMHEDEIEEEQPIDVGVEPILLAPMDDD